MRIFSGFTMFFYTLVFLIIGISLIGFSLNLIPLEEVFRIMDFSYGQTNLRLATGGVGILLIIYSLVAVQVTLGNLQREKTIAFDNPSGRVTISLSAIEDFIRRASANIREVKELRADVKAGKKAINITNRVVVYQDANIPETTERIQNILKTRIQDMLGIEEPINIKVHITKIVSQEMNEKRHTKNEDGGKNKPFFKGIEYSNS